MRLMEWFEAIKLNNNDLNPLYLSYFFQYCQLSNDIAQVWDNIFSKYVYIYTVKVLSEGSNSCISRFLLLLKTMIFLDLVNYEPLCCPVYHYLKQWIILSLVHRANSTGCIFLNISNRWYSKQHLLSLFW